MNLRYPLFRSIYPRALRPLSFGSFGVFAATVFALFVWADLAIARSVNEDVEVYARLFDGDKSLHSDAANALESMGLSDTRLFDIIERRLLQDYNIVRDDRPEKDRVARYIRALGFSGQAKYKPTLEKLRPDKDYGRYAKTALEDLPLYEKWNPIISNRASFNPKYEDEVNRVLNMLRADDFLLKRVGAKRVYFGVQDDEVLNTLEEQVRASYLIEDRKLSDSISWMVKALASAQKEKYRPLLEQVAATAPDKKVQEYARSCLAGSGGRCSSMGLFIKTPSK